jgi:hypothetical protein
VSRRRYAEGLRLLEEAVAVEEQTRAWGFTGGTLDPRLKATLNAKGRRVTRTTRTALVWIRNGLPHDTTVGPFQPRSRAARLCQTQPSDSEAQGLSPAPNPSKRTRYGLKGLPSRAKSRVETGCRLLEHDRALCSFWTPTLPEEAIKAIENGQGSTQALTFELRREITRLQRRKNLPEEAVGVLEVQPRRHATTGTWAPHWHVVMRSRHHGKGRWLFNEKDLDALWHKVVLRVTGVDISTSPEHVEHNACNLQPIRKTVAGYLRAYLKKGSSPQCIEAISEVAPALVPHQWWFMTAALLEVIKSLTRRLDPLFWAFVNEMEQQLKRDGLVFALWRGKTDGKPPRVTYSFPTLEALAHVIALFQSTDLSGPGWKAVRECAAPP